MNRFISTCINGCLPDRKNEGRRPVAGTAPLNSVKPVFPPVVAVAEIKAEFYGFIDLGDDLIDSQPIRRFVAKSLAVFPVVPQKTAAGEKRRRLRLPG